MDDETKRIAKLLAPESYICPLCGELIEGTRFIKRHKEECKPKPLSEAAKSVKNTLNSF